MKWSFAAILLAVAALLGPLFPMVASGDAPRQEPPVILCFGDSLTAGFGVAREESYPALLQERLREAGYPHRVVNAGVSGDTTAGGLRRLGWALRSDPVIAIVALGANDGLRGLEVNAMAENLAAIITRLRTAGVQVLLAGMRIPPNYGEAYTRDFAAVYPRLAAEHHLPLLPFLLEGVAGQPGLNQPDGIHPTAAGYRVVAEGVWQALLPLLDSTPAPAEGAAAAESRHSDTAD